MDAMNLGSIIMATVQTVLKESPANDHPAKVAMHAQLINSYHLMILLKGRDASSFYPEQFDKVSREVINDTIDFLEKQILERVLTLPNTVENN